MMKHRMSYFQDSAGVWYARCFGCGWLTKSKDFGSVEMAVDLHLLVEASPARVP